MTNPEPEGQPDLAHLFPTSATPSPPSPDDEAAVLEDVADRMISLAAALRELANLLHRRGGGR